MMLLLLLLVPLAALEIHDEYNKNDLQEFLLKYGYINGSELVDIKSALVAFQERYNLPVDGTLNNQTIALLTRPRCSHKENEFRIQSGWAKRQLYWYFPKANATFIKLTTQAFNIWEQNSVLTFRRTTNPAEFPPDITISLSRGSHRYKSDCRGNHPCPNNFDGPGKVLAHTDFPYGGCVEIHIDMDEHWDFSDVPGPLDPGATNFLMTVTHEIGHALGIAHSDTEDALMFAWYQHRVRPLHQDDIMAVEYLYGRRHKYDKIPTSVKAMVPTTTNPTTVPSVAAKPTIKNLCDIKSPDFMFLAVAPSFPNYRMYIGYQKLVWKLDLNEIKIPSTPENLSDYLPEELKGASISQIYQNSAGNLITVDKNTHRCYAASFPNINVHDDYQIRLPSNSRINTIFQSNSGKTYVFYDNNSYIGFIDNPEQIEDRGYIDDIFPGIPNGVSSAFRFTDGYIYFFHKNTYYKYSEYQRKVILAAPWDWNIFNVPCPNGSLMNKLKVLLTKVISFYE